MTIGHGFSNNFGIMLWCFIKIVLGGLGGLLICWITCLNLWLGIGFATGNPIIKIGVGVVVEVAGLYFGGIGRIFVALHLGGKAHHYII